MNKEEIEKEARKAYIRAVEYKVKEYQGKNFVEWHYWKEKLEELEPDNPMLKEGFHGKPYTSGYYS